MRPKTRWPSNNVSRCHEARPISQNYAMACQKRAATHQDGTENIDNASAPPERSERRQKRIRKQRPRSPVQRRDLASWKGARPISKQQDGTVAALPTHQVTVRTGTTHGKAPLRTHHGTASPVTGQRNNNIRSAKPNSPKIRRGITTLRFSRSPPKLGNRRQDATTGAGRKMVAQPRPAPAKTHEQRKLPAANACSAAHVQCRQDFAIWRDSSETVRQPGQRGASVVLANQQ